MYEKHVYQEELFIFSQLLNTGEAESKESVVELRSSILRQH